MNPERTKALTDRLLTSLIGQGLVCSLEFAVGVNHWIGTGKVNCEQIPGEGETRRGHGLPYLWPTSTEARGDGMVRVGGGVG